MVDVLEMLANVLEIAFLPIVCNLILYIRHNQVTSEEKRFHVKHMDEVLFSPDRLMTAAIYNPINSRRRKRMVLALDLDETLVYCTRKRYNRRRLPDAQMELYVTAKIHKYNIYRRPYLDLFLYHVSMLYEVVVFTASKQSYADPLINFADRYGSVRRRFYRDSCVQRGETFLKDLSAVVKHDLSKVLIIDNCAMGSWLNPENIIPISSYNGQNPADHALLDLLPFLMTLEVVQDVRSLLRYRKKAE